MTNRSGDTGEVPIVVRDLEWIITAPFMLAKTPEPNLSILPETKRLLVGLRQDPAPLLTYLESLNRHTLGSYFEHLVIFWLKNLPSANLLATNLQVFDGKTTTGEFDLLFTYQNTCYHWELAVKFYLNIGPGAGEADFVGPKRQDNLDRKLTHLFDHQLQLSKTLEAKDQLNQIGAKDIHPYAWVKGVLFQPALSMKNRSLPLPDRVSQNCPVGLWCRLDDLNSVQLPEFDHYLLPRKPNWLASFYYQGETMSGDKKALVATAKKALTEREEPLLVYLLAKNDPPELEVIERVFIVPDRWAH